MPGEVTFAPEVAIDLAEAYFWYERKRPGLGDDFLSAVDACVERIRLSPGIYREVYRNYRRAVIHRFPYALFYQPRQDQTTTVYAVIHTSRSPETWCERLM